MLQYQYTSELYHHGVKGMKWGVRRYQYADGSLTPAGKKKREVQNETGIKRATGVMEMKVKDVVNQARYQVTGRQYVDSYLSKGTTFARIQTSKEFENFAFYATYKKTDQDKYLGLFGKNLTDRAAADAKKAAKLAKTSGTEADKANAKALRERADNIKVYQLKFETTKKLRIPSDENAGDITAKLLKEPDFRKNAEASIRDSRELMKRPSQQILFKQAENAMKKKPDMMTPADKVAVYKAFNLSLTYHNPQQQAAQSRFYGELKKKGYDALLDYNDKDYSSYHAKRPTIVFNTDAVRLKSVTETNPKVVNQLYKKYNAERITKESIGNTFGLLEKIGTKTVAEASSYVDKKERDYMR